MLENVHKFKQPYDRLARWITICVLLLVVGILVYLAITSTGSYLPGWFAMIAIAILALASLSIPRYVYISANNIEIHCLVKFTAIPLGNVKRVTSVSKGQLKWVVPVPFAGTYGIFGYFGYYCDLKNFNIIKLYARGWNNFVMIEDIYDETVFVGTTNAQEFINHFPLDKHDKDDKSGEHDEHDKSNNHDKSVDTV